MRLAVEDNGVGFKVEEALARQDSFGLSGMRERVALLGGSFEIKSYPKNGNVPLDRRNKGRGTKVWITLPVAKESPVLNLRESIATKQIGGRPTRRIRAVPA